MQIQARNDTAGALSFDQLSVPDGEIAAGATVDLTATNSITEIREDTQLNAYIAAGWVTLIQDGVDLSTADALQFTGGGPMVSEQVDRFVVTLLNETTFALTRAPGVPSEAQVHVNRTLYENTHWSIVGSVLTWAGPFQLEPGPPADVVVVRYF